MDLNAIEDLNEKLIAAIKADDASAARTWLERGADPNIRAEFNPYGFGDIPTPALMIALDWRLQRPDSRSTERELIPPPVNRELIGVLLEAGADANVHAPGHWTPLTTAVYWSEIKLLDMLVAFGADVNRVDDHGKAPLHWACTIQDPVVVSRLLAAGADANVRTRSRDTPLHDAARFSTADVVSALLAAGADVDARNDARETALMGAAENGRLETVSVLLAAGASCKVRDRDRKTALARVERYQRGPKAKIKRMLTEAAAVG